MNRTRNDKDIRAESVPHKGPVCKDCGQDFYYDFGDMTNWDFVNSGCCINCYQPSSWGTRT